MLTCPQRPLLCVSHIIPPDVILYRGNGTFINSILYQTFTTDLCSLMHRCDHNVTNFFFVYFCHSHSHNMYDIKNYFASLFAGIYTRKSYSNTFSLNRTLIQKDITRGPVVTTIMNYF